MILRTFDLSVTRSDSEGARPGSPRVIAISVTPRGTLSVADRGLIDTTSASARTPVDPSLKPTTVTTSQRVPSTQASPAS